MLRAFVAQSILHGLVAGLLVEALLRAWRVQDGAWRLRFRLLALVEPVLILPLLFLAPSRLDPSFAADWALYSSGRWNLLRVGGAGLGDLALVCVSGIGALLFLRDAVPPLLETLRGAPGDTAHSPGLAVPRALTDMVRTHAAALGVEPPPVRVIRSRLPVLLCEHARRPGLVISAATFEALDADSLDGAVAHEVVHAAHRDPLWGYVLIAARALTFFNPATQWTARLAVDEVERRADQMAARMTRRPDALARAVGVLSVAAQPTSAAVADRFERLFWQSRVAAVGRRSDRILAGDGASPLEFGSLRFGLAIAGLVLLLFFVV